MVDSRKFGQLRGWMMKVQKSQGVLTNFRLTAKRAEQMIRKAASDSANVILGYHTEDRQSERDIFDEDVFRILRTGMVLEDPVKTPKGEWKCKVVKKLRGNRDAGAVTIFLSSGKLFVKTIEWEDLK
jgi:hypothetical protein